MPHLIKSKYLEVLIDLPTEHYNFSRFDWTGKIAAVHFKGIPITTVEDPEHDSEYQLGKAFYNEFGIDSPLGFKAAAVGEWFHKIGIGLLKKEDANYGFDKNYLIRPAKFELVPTDDSLTIICTAAPYNGYSYILTKKLTVEAQSFSIAYSLRNTGERPIVTDEYVHNFVAFNNAPMGPDYQLKFPFQLKVGSPGEIVNPDSALIFKSQQLSFRAAPKQQFFASYLNGNQTVAAEWELHNTKQCLLLKESDSFQTKKINLWGAEHVISPELFFDIYLKPGKAVNWSRTFTVSVL